MLKKWMGADELAINPQKFQIIWLWTLKLKTKYKFFVI